jgi:hypothetical protein
MYYEFSYPMQLVRHVLSRIKSYLILQEAICIPQKQMTNVMQDKLASLSLQLLAFRFDVLLSLKLL